jgi:hypothetical protein
VAPDRRVQSAAVDLGSLGEDDGGLALHAGEVALEAAVGHVPLRIALIASSRGATTHEFRYGLMAS